MTNAITKDKGVTYTIENGDELSLNMTTIRTIICPDANVTDQECLMFMALCKAQRLNPFTKEAHLIKYGSQPATMVVGKDVFTKRAMNHPKFRGYTAGLFVTKTMPDGKTIGKEREGSMIMPGEQVVGAWCKVYVDGYNEPMYDSVSFEEYAGRKKDGSLNQTWASKPGTMIRKVAIVHALREAFPDQFAGLYDSAELSDKVEPANSEPIQAEVEKTFDEPIEYDTYDYQPFEAYSEPVEPEIRPPFRNNHYEEESF